MLQRTFQETFQKTFQEIEEKLNSESTLDPRKRAELQRLLAIIKEEVDSLGGNHSDDQDSIARFTRVSTEESLRKGGNPRLQELSLEGLRTSVEHFEVSHPSLTGVVNKFCNFLSDLGI